MITHSSKLVIDLGNSETRVMTISGRDSRGKSKNNLTVMDNRYEVSSNREAGEGRYDICLSPKPGNEQLPGILIELKAAQKCTQPQLKKLAGEALKQINEKRYDTLLRSRKKSSVLKYGVAFCGKAVEIVVG